MRRHDDRLERFLRGASGSSVVHGVLALLIMAAARVPVSFPQAPEDRPITIVTTSLLSTAIEQIQKEKPFGDLANEPQTSSIPLRIEGGPDGAAFSIDLARIRARRNDLFPFLTWDLSFVGERPASRGGRLQLPSEFAPAVPAGAEPLRLSEDDLQALVDRAWSRRDRWNNLRELVQLTERHHADIGDLPRAFREYNTQNIPQPYEDWDFADPVFWATLALTADDAPLVEFVTRYVRQHPASRVSTELLLLLDAHAESNCEIFVSLLGAGTPRMPLIETRRESPEAFALAQTLATAYRRWVLRHRVDVADRCIAVRSAMLLRVIDATPDRYGAADARFRLGEMLWTAGQRRAAVEWWKGAQPDPRGQYARVSRDLRGAILDGAADGNQGRINGILLEERRRWRAAAGVRLERFGWSATRF
jgi:hypothetical protein